MVDSYLSPLKGSFYFSGRLPNIFILTQISAVTSGDHWVPSEGTGLQSIPTASDGTEAKQREREREGASTVFTVQLIMAPKAFGRSNILNI